MSAATAAAGSRTIGVAVAVPEPYATELRGWREHFGDPQARSIPPHITLVPPTLVPDEALPAVVSHLERAARSEGAFEILLRGTGTFRPVSPVVFVAVPQGVGDLGRVERVVRRGLLDPPRRFPYHPHVTVAHDLGEAALDRAFETLADYEARFQVPGFSLYEHGADGVWRPLRTFSFRVHVPVPRGIAAPMAAGLTGL